MAFKHEKIAAAAALFAPTFGLQAYPGETFRFSETASYLSGPVFQPEACGVVLYTERLMPDGSWCDFAKGSPEEFAEQVVALPGGGETTTRYLGECQICEREHKLVVIPSTMGVPETLVHHGYRRPGHGSIVGDCPGVGHAPYERSCERLKWYGEGLDLRLGATRGRLAALRDGTATTVSRMRRQPGGREKLETLEKGTVHPLEWAQAIRHAIACLESEVRGLEREIQRVKARVERWAPAPIATVEERVRREDGQKAARAAARAEARAARTAKAAATAAKKKDLEDRRSAVKASFAAQIRGLAASSDTHERRHRAALKIGLELRKKKHAFIYIYELGVDDALAALGFATPAGTRPNGTQSFRYSYPFGG